ncbi:hypothetical protein L1887_28450 [Cichorium endivia]|nr:hypothetical protein L1887_28450 [Cichorium endivia]
MEDDKEEVKSFKELGVVEKLIEACDSLGWKNPSKIQAEAISHALEGKDLIGLAQMGSGKTGAFALPILQALWKDPQTFFACVLSPTRFVNLLKTGWEFIDFVLIVLQCS